MENAILYILILIIPLIAQINITSTYAKFKNKENSKKMSGFEVARAILDKNGLNNMYIVEVKGNLTDHYDPTKKVVRLSTDIFHGVSMAAIAVAAHECGHAIQDKENYSWMNIRKTLCPVVNFITYAAYVMFFLSILLQFIDLLMISIVVVLFGLLFQIVTLPVEFDASKRAINELEELLLVDDKDKDGVKSVLKAAAYTYVASVLSQLLNLVRLLLISSRRRD